MGGDSPPTVVRFGTACLGGLASWTIVHPINTVSVRRNLAVVVTPQSPPAPIAAFVTDLLRSGGLRGLYAGLTAGYTRQIFYTTSQVGLFETLRDEVGKVREMDLPTRLVVGCVSGSGAAVLSCPAEVALVRMSNDAALPPGARRGYRNVFDAAYQIVATEGPLRLFSGCGPFVCRAVLVGAFQIGAYDHFKEFFRSVGVAGQLANVTVSSFAAGAVYSSITMPFETAKNRLAFQRADSSGRLPYTGTLQCMRSCVAAGGVSSLWAGFTPYYTRCCTFSVVMFLAVEYLRAVYATLSSPS